MNNNQTNKDRTSLEDEVTTLLSKVELNYFFPDVPPKVISGSIEIEICGVKLMVPDFGEYEGSEDGEICRRLVEHFRNLDEDNKYYTPQRRTKYRTIKAERGKTLDLVSLLTLHGKRDTLYSYRKGETTVKVEVESLLNKHVFICCFNVPIIWNEPSQDFAQAIVEIYQELKETYGRKAEFRLVVIAKMRPGFGDNYDIFRHFCSGFPPDCVFVPFEDKERRQFICDSFGLRERPEVAGCVLAPDERVMLVDNSFRNALTDYGAEAFPFTDERIHKLDEHCREMPNCHTLRSLLGCNCDPRYFYLYNNIYPERKMSIAQLEKTLVLVYLCAAGYDFISHLIEVQKQCQERGLDLEIILVYNPYVSQSPPLKFQKLVNDVLQNLQLSCWVLPFRDSVARRLEHFREDLPNDWLIVVGPHGTYMDPSANFVIRDFGIDAYPFTRKVAFDRELEMVKKITLDLFLPQSRKVLQKVDDAWVEKEPGIELLGKSVILYFVIMSDWCHDEPVNARLLKWYSQAKRNHLEVEVIFVGVDLVAKHFMDHEIVSAMPWLVCPYDPKYSDYVVEKILEGLGLPSTLVAFGKDGAICSLDAASFLFRTAESLVLEDTLAKDVLMLLRGPGEYRDYMDNSILEDN